MDCNINAWQCDFLTNRKMRVFIEGEKSEAVPVDSGVPPENSAWAPTIFCQVNNLPDAVKFCRGLPTVSTNKA